jgi:hypothetical protein
LLEGGKIKKATEKKGRGSFLFFDIMIIELIKIKSDIDKEYKWNEYILIDELKINPTNLPQILWEEFLINPNAPTDAFIEEFIKCPNFRNIGPLFLMKSMNCDELPEEILSRTLVCDQRSPEWYLALDFYSCGTNQGIIPYVGDNAGFVRHYYNLIRGCFAELLIISNINFNRIIGEKCMKISVGMIVEKFGVENMIGVSPDLLLMTADMNIIPVEIKCIRSSNITSSKVRREINLAKRQLKRCCELTQSTKGLIILVHMVNAQIYLSYKIIDY